MTRRFVASTTAVLVGLVAALGTAVPASAAPATPWEQFADAYQSSGTASYVLTGDVTGSGALALPGTKTFTLDLAGNDLTVTGSADRAGLGVHTGAMLVIRDTVGGGVLTATGGQYGAGIGASRFTAAGTVRIESGTVIARGSEDAAGIGGARAADAGTITISGGTVRAQAGNYAAGLGGASSRAAGVVTISGGTVDARGGAFGSGIGGGSTATGGVVSITGGTVTATGGDYGPGIGTAWHGAFGTVSLTGGTITATGGNFSAGIGGGWETDGVSVAIGPGATVTAANRFGASAIGPGRDRTAFGTLVVDGRLRIAPGATLALPAGVTVGGTGVLENRGLIPLDGTLTVRAVENHGTIRVGPAGAVDHTRVTDRNHLLTFTRGNGEVDTTMRVYAASLAEDGRPAPAAPVRSGYTFTGWTTGGSAWSPQMFLQGDTTITAGWERILQPFTTPPTVAITGTPRVGIPLTAEVTTPAVPAATSHTFQWSRAGTPIPGADTATYTPVAADLGAALTVAVTAILDGHTAVNATGSATTPAIGEGTFTQPLDVAITGTRAVGSTLTAVITRDAAPIPTSYAYVWSANGTPIPGATGAALALTPVLVDARISVTATPELAGLIGSTGAGTSAETAPVAPGPFTAPAVVEVTGAAVVGATLTATVTTDAAPRPTAYAFQWSADGTPIPGATGPTLTVDAALHGAALTVTASPVLAGYAAASGAAASPATAAVGDGAFTGTPRAVVTGTARAGATVTAETVGTFTPAPTSLTYAWYAGAAPIPGATGATLTIPRTAAGATLTVRITAHATGYASRELVSDGILVSAAPTIALSIGSVVSGGSVTVTGTGFVGTGPLTVELHSTPVRLGGLTPAADGSVSGTFAIPAGTPAGAHTVVVLAADGSTVATAPVQVVAPSAAATGSAAAAPTVIAAAGGQDVTGTVLTGLLLLTAGTLVVLRRRAPRAGTATGVSAGE